MTLVISNEKLHYELENLCRIFFPDEKIKVIVSEQIEDDDIVVLAKAIFHEDKVDLSVVVKYYNSEKSDEQIDYTIDSEYINKLSVMIFKILSKFTGINPTWGILTGVRPIKLIRSLVKDLGSELKAEKYFKENLLVSDEKTKLALNVMKAEQKILDLSTPRSFSLYVSIPFCPTRCSYCSFVSQSVEKAKKLMPQYFELLLEEIKITAQIADTLGLRLETVYIGGGTPTTLDPVNLAKMLLVINDSFDLSFCREFTVEAGRPDTIDKEKLLALRENVNSDILRISINPQTLNDNVLEAIGRKHTAEQSIEAYKLAKSLGLKNINMDLIVGLPKDDFNGFKYSLDTLCELSPQAITVHTLSMKRSSNLIREGKRVYKDEYDLAKNMLDYAYSKLSEEEYYPYYLYRQSKMVANLENTGFSKANFECAYNAYIMDETHTILACGAGAVTKLKSPFGKEIERIFNYKYPYEFIDRFSDIIKRKEGVRNFYARFF